MAKISQEQKHILLDFIEGNEDIAKSKFSPRFTAKDAAKLWEMVTLRLNACPGAKKSWKDWRKTWQDIKSAVKAKVGALNLEMQRTGGGPPIEEELTDFQARIFKIIGSNAAIGHAQTRESPVSLQFQVDHPIISDSPESSSRSLLFSETQNLGTSDEIFPVQIIASTSTLISPFGPSTAQSDYTPTTSHPTPCPDPLPSTSQITPSTTISNQFTSEPNSASLSCTQSSADILTYSVTESAPTFSTSQTRHLKSKTIRRLQTDRMSETARAAEAYRQGEMRRTKLLERELEMKEKKLIEMQDFHHKIILTKEKKNEIMAEAVSLLKKIADSLEK